MKKLLVIIPALNEEEKIGGVIKDIPRKIKGVSKVEILVIDDGSTDNTSKIAKKMGARVIRNPFNMGVGAAFDKGLQQALNSKFDVMVNIDADGQFDSRDLLKLIKPIMANEADFVTASRFINKDYFPQMPTVKLIGNKLMSKLVSSLVGKSFFDVSCGFRAYSREALLSLNLQGHFTYTQESFFNLAFKGIRIIEIPVGVKYFKDRKSRVASSISRYMINTLKIILKTYRDYKPFGFFFRIALIFFIFGVVSEAILVWTFITRGEFSPNIWSGFVGAALFFVAIIFFAVGLLADMNTRIRLNQEKILYFLKKQKVAE